MTAVRRNSSHSADAINMNLVTVDLCSALKTLAEPLGHLDPQDRSLRCEGSPMLPDYLRALVD